jgi:hypothetical protein
VRGWGASPGASVNDSAEGLFRPGQLFCADLMRGLDEDKLALSGSPSQTFGSGDGLTLSCEIDGRFASEYVIAVNCDGNRIAAGKRQFKRLVEMGVDPIVFLTFRGGARSLRV